MDNLPQIQEFLEKLKHEYPYPTIEIAIIARADLGLEDKKLLAQTIVRATNVEDKEKGTYSLILY